MRVFVRDRKGSRLMSDFYDNGRANLDECGVPTLWRVCTVGRCFVGVYKLLNILELVVNFNEKTVKDQPSDMPVGSFDVQRCKRLLEVLKSQRHIMDGSMPRDSGELSFPFFFERISVNLKEWKITFDGVDMSIDALIFLAVLYSEICLSRNFEFNVSDLLIPSYRTDHYELIMRRYNHNKKFYDELVTIDGPDYLYDPAEATLSKLNLESSIRRSKNAY